MTKETEPVRISSKTMNKLRLYLSEKTKGRMYGEIGKTIEEAIELYLDFNDYDHMIKERNNIEE